MSQKRHQCNGTTILGYRCRRLEFFNTGYCRTHLRDSTISRDSGIQLFQNVTFPLYFPNRPTWHENLSSGDRTSGTNESSDSGDTTCCMSTGKTPNPITISPGRSDLPTYILESRMGYGTYGNVYLAIPANERTRHVAIKIMKTPLYKHLAYDDFATEFRMHEVIRRRVRDQEVMRHLLLPENYFVLFKQNKLYGCMVMEAMNGDAKDALRRSGDQTGETLKIFSDICKAIRELHRNRIYHLDFKLSNVMYNDNHVYKLGDFGLSGYYGGKCPVKIRCTGTYIPPEWRVNIENDRLAKSAIVTNELEADKAELYAICYTLLRALEKTDKGGDFKMQNIVFISLLRRCVGPNAHSRDDVTLDNIISYLDQAIKSTNTTSDSSS